MAVYFELRRNGKPIKFATVDDEMREALGVEPNPDSYYKNWYDSIGFSIACGQSWDKIKEIWGETKMDCIQFIETNFDPECWGGR